MANARRRRFLFGRMGRHQVFDARNVPASEGVELITNGGFSSYSAWSVSGGWGINGGVASTANGGSIGQDGALALPGWYRARFDLLAIPSGSLALNFAGGGNLVSRSFTTPGTQVATHRRGTSILQFDSSAGSSQALDNVSLTRLVEASVYDLVPDVIRDGVFQASVSATIGYQAGIGSFDNETNPQNGWLVYVCPGAGRLHLDKIVAGVWTSVIAAAITYTPGKLLQLVRTNTTFGVYYDSAQIGSTSTLSDLPTLSYFGGFRTNTDSTVIGILHHL